MQQFRKMAEIILSNEMVEIINKCLKSVECGNMNIDYGIKIPNKEQFMLDPDIPEGNLIDRMQSDIKVEHKDIEDFKNMLAENPEEDIFEFMFELDLSINGFPIIEREDYVEPDGFTGCEILVITPKTKSIAGLTELYEFMEQLKENNRISPLATIEPVYWER